MSDESRKIKNGKTKSVGQTKPSKSTNPGNPKRRPGRPRKTTTKNSKTNKLERGTTVIKPSKVVEEKSPKKTDKKKGVDKTKGKVVFDKVDNKKNKNKTKKVRKPRKKVVGRVEPQRLMKKEEYDDRVRYLKLSIHKHRSDLSKKVKYENNLNKLQKNVIVV